MLRHGRGRHTHGADARAGSWRFLFADQAPDFVERGVLELCFVEWCAACEQFVEQHTE